MTRLGVHAPQDKVPICGEGKATTVVACTEDRQTDKISEDTEQHSKTVKFK